jgi:hypothetical protein
MSAFAGFPKPSGRQREPAIGRRTLSGRIAISLIAAGVAAIQLTGAVLAEQICHPLVGEVSKDLNHSGLPEDAARWAAAERIWRQSSAATKEEVQSMLRGGGLSPAVDTIQGLTNDLLREAIRHNRRELAADLLGLWTMPFSTVSHRDKVLSYYVTDSQRIGDAVFQRPHPMWVGSDGFETVLYSAIYLAGATDVAKAIVDLPAASRSEQMSDFVIRVGGLSLDHYLRWSFGPPGIWQVNGWGCNASGLDLVEFTAKRLDRTLGNGSQAYCIAPTDLDMLIAIGITNLLAIAKAAPDMAPISAHDRERLQHLVNLQARFMASRLVWTQSTDAAGTAQRLLDFDPGSWAAHPEYLYAGDDSPDLPDKPPPLGKGIGWDFSHGARIAWMMLTFAGNGEVIDDSTEWDRRATGLAHQLSQRVLAPDASLPRFRNFLDGSNGWYRVSYEGRSGSGTPPYGLSRAYLNMPWARLSARDQRLATATTGIWRMLGAPSPAHCELLRQTYVDGSYWQNGKPSPQPLTGVLNQIEMLPFIASSPVR